MSERKVLCLYHGNCYDGFGAAWAVRHWAKKNNIEVEYRGTATGKEPEDATGFTDIFMCDFTYKYEVVEAYWNAGHHVIIMDHHKSNAEDPKLGRLHCSKYKNLDNILDNKGMWAYFDINRSGAGLVWDILNPNEERPPLINYIEDRDIWNNKLPNTLEHNASIMSYNLTFENFDFLNHRLSLWNNIDFSFREGEAILRKRNKDVHDLLSIKQTFKIDGYYVPAVNVPWILNSDLGSELSKGERFAVTYFDGNTHTVVSLRSQKDGGIDVAEIAKKYGGGGHKNASSFRMPLGWRGDENNK